VKVVAIFLSVLVSVGVSAQTARPASQLRQDPSDQSKVIKKMTGAEQIKIKGRKGFWVQITVDGSQGWLTLKDLAPKAGSRSVGIDTGRTGKGNIVATSSARGLNAESLISAKPNFERLRALSGFAVSAGAATDFAAAGGVTIRNISLIEVSAAREKNAVKNKKPRKTVKRKNGGDDDDDDDDDDD
jgi:uncharacterized protein YgiM (DUF1202 family)